MLNHLINLVNKILQKAWVSKNFLLHKLSDILYDIACFLYKIINIPSNDEIKKTISEWEGPAITNKNLIMDIRSAWLKYGFSPKEYFAFNYRHLNKSSREEYISEVNLAKYSSILNDRSQQPLFTHKYASYLKFKKFYKRECIKSTDIDVNFIEKNPTFFFKPENSAQGKDAKIIHVNNQQSLQNISRSTPPNWNNGICEELIVQDEWMAAFNPSSVNTLRIKTLTHLSGEIIIFAAIFRMGRKGEVTDNASINGIMAEVDPETGVVITDGYDELGHKFKAHPDSGMEINGVIIPKYTEAVKKAKEMASLVSAVRYISWDLALTHRGWVLVEANIQGGFVHQITEGHGCKKEFLQQIRS